jgi:serine/threonine protein phosphatase PrpC
MTTQEQVSNGSTNQVFASVEAAGTTHVGRHRPLNEDAYLIATLQRSMVVHDACPAAARGWFAGGSAGTLLVVADGMGGQGGGEVASRIAINTVASYLLNVMSWTSGAVAPTQAPERESLPGVREQLSSALVIGDSTVKDAAAGTATPAMGTTLTMALVLWPMLYVAHVGDTRCYLLRSGTLRRLTTDHTLAQKMASTAAIPLDPESQLNHVLWNSLGGSAEVPQPEVVKIELDLGDRLLLCSDGLTKHVSDEQIAAYLSADQPNAERCARLVDHANAGGGSDNVTVVVASMVPVPILPATLPNSVAPVLPH